MKDNTHITVVLDKSGSMYSIKHDTIGGFNTFKKGQQETAKPGDTFSLVQFSDGYHYTHKNYNIREVPDLTDLTYLPSGSTALLLTLTHAINELGAHFRSLKEEDRPGKVVFVILTDGEENSSGREYSKAHVKKLITEQSEKYSWEFIFLGANQDAIQEGSSYGISQWNSMSYGATGVGVVNLFAAATRGLNTYKSAPVGQSFASSGGTFTAEERTASMGGVVPPVANVVTGVEVTGAWSKDSTNYVPPTSKNGNVKDDGHEVKV